MDRWLHRLDLFAYGPPAGQHLIAELPRLTLALSTRLAATLYPARHPADALVRLRAAQAALFRVGLLLHHEPRLATVPGRALGCPLTPYVAATINRSMSTAAAAAVLHLVYPLGARYPLTRTPTWRLSQIDPDGEQVHTEHGPIPVPACGHPLLRAHLHWRNSTGDTDPDAALLDERRHSFNELAQQALRPINLHDPIDVGYRRSRAYLRGHATAWMLQRGLELSALAELAPRPGPQ